MDETAQTALKLGTSEQDASIALEATQSDVGPQPGKLPLVVAAGVRLAKTKNVAEVELDQLATWAGRLRLISSTVRRASALAAAAQSRPFVA